MNLDNTTKILLVIISCLVLALIIGLIMYFVNKQSYQNDHDMIISKFTKLYGNDEESIKIGKAILTNMSDKGVVGPPPNPIEMPSLNVLNADYYDTETSQYCAYLVNLAYALDENVSYDENNSEPAITFLNNQLNLTTSENFHIIDVLNFKCNDKPTYGGFILEVYDNNGVALIFIIIRGTVHLCEWVQDAEFILKTPDWQPEIKVHTGFNNVYTSNGGRSIRNIVFDYLRSKNPDTISKIIISGHSLGGGISNLITVDMAKTLLELRDMTKVFTFAAPYTGDDNFARNINNNGINFYSGLFQIINVTDPVPTAKEPGYSRPQYQSFVFKAGSIAAAHLMDSYIAGITKCSGRFDQAQLINKLGYCGYDLGRDFSKMEEMTHWECIAGNNAEVNFYNNGTYSINIQMIGYPSRYDNNGVVFKTGNNYTAGLSTGWINVPLTLTNSSGDFDVKFVRVIMEGKGMFKNETTTQEFDIEPGMKFQVDQDCYWPKSPCSSLAKSF